MTDVVFGAVAVVFVALGAMMILGFGMLLLMLYADLKDLLR
jgi:hypothetical protein